MLNALRLFVNAWRRSFSRTPCELWRPPPPHCPIKKPLSSNGAGGNGRSFSAPGPWKTSRNSWFVRPKNLPPSWILIRLEDWPLLFMAIEITRELLGLAIQRLAQLTGEKEFVAVGRGTLAITAPPALARLATTDDIDIWPRHNEKAALEESIFELGEASNFHERHGFYIERLGAWTLLTQPPGWEDRATILRFGDNTLLVLGLLDLLYNKLEANRPKDRAFIQEAIACKLANLDVLREFIQRLAPNCEARQTLLKNLADRVGARG